MDKEFLNRVIDQIVSETTVYYDLGVYMVQSPFVSEWFHLNVLYHNNHSFYLHCRDVYGLDRGEIKYVWGKYKIRVHAMEIDMKIKQFEDKTNGQ
jgi:hypothetical protein